MEEGKKGKKKKQREAKKKEAKRCIIQHVHGTAINSENISPDFI
jgi:ribosome maturation protein Sdo1